MLTTQYTCLYGFSKAASTFLWLQQAAVRYCEWALPIVIIELLLLSHRFINVYSFALMFRLPRLYTKHWYTLGLIYLWLSIVSLYLHFVMSDLSVESWKKKHGIKHLGVPRYVASGTHVNGSTRYRFLVMDQFGEDVEKKFTEYGRKFNITTVCSLAIQLVCSLHVCTWFSRWFNPHGMLTL